MNTTENKPCSPEKKLVNLGIKRTDDGLQITLQSPVDWKIMKHPTQKFTLGGVVCFRPTIDQIEGIESYFVTEQGFEFNGFPNLTMLLAEDIKSGVRFTFPPQPLSDEKIKRWLEQFKRDAKVLYLMFVKPVDYSVTISTCTVERESHD